MNGSEVISIIALAIATPSAVAAAVSLVLGLRESSRRDTEIRLLRDEAVRRDEELSLLRAQLLEERSEREKSNRAKLILDSGGGISTEHRVQYGVRITNAGPHTATQIALWLEDAGGTRIGEPAKVATLMTGETDLVHLDAPPQAHEPFLGPYGVFVEWWDGRGYQSEPRVLRLERV